MQFENKINIYGKLERKERRDIDWYKYYNITQKKPAFFCIKV